MGMSCVPDADADADDAEALVGDAAGEPDGRRAALLLLPLGVASDMGVGATAEAADAEADAEVDAGEPLGAVAAAAVGEAAGLDAGGGASAPGTVDGTNPAGSGSDGGANEP